MPPAATRCLGIKGALGEVAVTGVRNTGTAGLP